MKRGQLRRKAPLSRRTPMRSKRTAPKVRRLPAPGRAFWETQRARLATRSGGRCERCGCDLNAVGMEAHHRKLRSQGGGHEITNLVALCPACHRRCHDKRLRAINRGLIVPSFGNPEARPVVLHDGRTVLLTEAGTYDVIFNGRKESA